METPFVNHVLLRLYLQRLEVCSARVKKNRQHVSNADRKVFATCSLLAEEFPDNLENVRMLHKISKYVQIIWKVSKKSKKCPDNLENVSGSSGKCLDDLESFLMI